MTEFAYLKPSDWPAWSRCAGKPSLEESEEPGAEPEFLKTPEIMSALKPRLASYKASGQAVQSYPYSRVDISTVTGEKGAYAFVDAIVIAPVDDLRAVLEIWQHEADEGQLKILGLAAMLKYEMLHAIAEVKLVTFTPGVDVRLQFEVTPDELYVFGQSVTEAAAIALSVRADVTALSNLKPGAVQCRKCRAAYRCPELAKALDLA
jgi:Protein of unknown function (DUF2800)